MEYPVPRHLRALLRIDTKHSNAAHIGGTVVCKCGCERFGILHNADAPYDDSLPYGAHPGMKIKGICADCGAAHLLLDAAVHGYDGFVCHDYKSALDSSLTPLQCGKCGAGTFGIRLDIEAEDREQFIAECVSDAPDEFVPEDYVDAFGWITVTVTCDACHRKDTWIDLETA